jgi:hypothetical protein
MPGLRVDRTGKKLDDRATRSSYEERSARAAVGRDPAMAAAVASEVAAADSAETPRSPGLLDRRKKMTPATQAVAGARGSTADPWCRLY